MKNQNLNQCGFMLLSVVFLTLIVSLSAQILLNANSKVQQRNSTLYLTAINLANEQFAEIEGQNLPAGNYNFLGNEGDLESRNGVREDSEPTKFDVSAEVGEGNLREVKVTVKWNVGGRENSIVSKKKIRAR
ncbi:MAG: hypothetical protein J5809_00060 [Selenomonadaceae bacterium]|nr:hypothetical protein [Selenomonadaceae bacterium]